MTIENSFNMDATNVAPAEKDEAENIADISAKDQLTSDKNSAPIWFCKKVVSRPTLVFAIALGCHVFMLLLTVLLIVSGYDILPVDFAKVPLNLEDDSTKLRTDAWKFAQDAAVIADPAKAGGQDRRGITYQTLQLVYELQGGNVLTRGNLLQIKNNEDKMFQEKTYKEKLCQLQARATHNRTCRRPFSILRLFDGTYKHIHAVFYDPDYHNIPQVLITAVSINLTRSFLNYHLGNDVRFDKSQMSVSTSYCRSLAYIGWPLENYQNTQQNQKEQINELDSYISEAFQVSLNERFEEGVGSMNFYYDNLTLRKKAIQQQVIKDMMLAMLSFIFIVLFMWFQTGSLWITSWAIFSIFSCFNITNLIYRIILDYRYFGIFHILSIFIILGIGADDVFVFTDTWKQSEKESFKSQEHRLSFVYRRTAKAMFITSFTTMVAFLSNVLSPLLAISSFGVFSAVLILVNYCSVVVFFPVVIILHEQSRKGQCCCCLSFQCRRGTPSTRADGDIVQDNAVQVQTSQARRQKRKGEYIIQFFEEVFFRKIVKHKVIRVVVLVFFIMLITVSVVFAVKLKPEEDQVEMWGPNTNWAKIKHLRKRAFPASQEDQVVKVYIIWGLMNQDRSECHHSDFNCPGRTVFDTSFDMNLPPCQREVLNFCKKMKSLPQSEVDKLRLRRNQVTGEIEIECFIQRMQEFFKDEGKKSNYPSNSDFSLPLHAEKMTKLMKVHPSLYNVSKRSDNYYRYFEVGLGFFLTNGSKTGYANNYDYQTYAKYFGGTQDIAESGTCEDCGQQGNQYGNRLLFMGVAVNTTLQVINLGYKSGLPIYENWEDYISSEMKKMPPSCNKAYQATVEGFNIWHWLKVQKVLIKNAVQGIVIGLVLTLVVLVIATTNLIVGILATFTIAMITCGVLATITIVGWKLGVLESLNMTLVVGLSVDYVVHLAEGYIELKEGNSLSRIKHTLGHVGISILSGACSTLGASVFMLAAKIVFFKQFGIFMFCTIGLSLLYSLLFFSTILALVGPEDDFGSILPAVQKVKDFIKGKSVDHEDCKKCEGKGFHVKGKD